MEPRVNHLQPTVFVDAVPELAAERKRRQETERPPETEDAEPSLASAA